MKTFFTVVENHSRQNLGVNIFTDEKYDFHQNREEFVFDTRYNALKSSHSLDRVEADIAEYLPNSSGDRRSPIELSQCAQSNVGGVNAPSEPPKVVQGCEQSSLTRPKHAHVMERIEVSPENETTNRQLFFMINTMKHHLKEKSSSTSNKYIQINVSKKFKYYNQTIQNIFLNNKIKETIKEIFCKSQRTYHAFLRFAQRIRIKQAKMNITTDLSMTPIEPNQKNTTIIYQNNTKYPFTLSDLINIILTSITNAPSLFPEPLVPKNPYNNIPFSKAILYHIYWAIKSSNILMPPLINSYFWSSFNFKKFIVNNEQAVRDYTIKKYVMNSPVTVLHDEIIDMLKNPLIKGRININLDFPKTKLVEIMKPYLFLYIMKNDGISGTEKRRVSNILFKREILGFIKYNPSFGRKTVKNNKITEASFFSRSHPFDTRPFNTRANEVGSESNLVTNSELLVQGSLVQGSSALRNDLDIPVPIPKDVKTVVFNTANPGLTIKEIEKMYKNYMNITPKNINEYDSESGENDSDSESDNNSIESYESDHRSNNGLPLERGLGTRIHGVGLSDVNAALMEYYSSTTNFVGPDHANLIIESFQNHDANGEEEAEPNSSSVPNSEATF